MKNKKKKISLKKVFLILIPIILAVAIGIGIYTKNKNDKNGVFSILEKRWIEKNKSTVVDVSILNDLPLFGDEGEGVFFDFLDDFEKETSIKFNMIPYLMSSTSTDKGYSFQVNSKSKLDANELLFYKDNYVMISKDNEKVKDFSSLSNAVIGVLDTDLSIVKEEIKELL